jgi:hypothetical protein
MGFNKNWSVIDINDQICTMQIEMNSPYNDGWTTWDIKQDLYQIKWLVDAALAETSVYPGEAEWLREQEQKKILKILKT